MGRRVALNFYKMEYQKNDDTEYYTSADSIVSKNGCAAGVKALRKGFELLLAVHTDSRFTGRLMKMVAEIFQRDHVKGKMKKSVLFSQHKEFLGTMVFNVRKRSSEIMLDQFVFTHSESRSEATVKVEEFFLKGCTIPGGATHFRILNHVSIVSDYCYSKSNRRYEPLSMLNGMCVCGYSDYLPVFGNQNIEVTVEFRDGVCPLEEDTVIHCIGIEFYQKQARNYYPYSSGSGVMVCDVF